MLSRQNSTEPDGTTIPITIQNSTSSRLSVSSLDRNQCFIRRLKLIGFILMISLSTATVAIASKMYQIDTVRNGSEDAKRLIAKNTVHHINLTLCGYLQQFLFFSGDSFGKICSDLINRNDENVIQRNHSSNFIEGEIHRWNYLKKLFNGFE